MMEHPRPLYTTTHSLLTEALSREGFQCLSSIVLPTIKATIHYRLYSPPQGSKQRRDQKGRGHHSEGGLLASVGDEGSLQHYDTAEVEYDQSCRQSAVDEGTVYDNVYVVEAVPEDGYVSTDWNEEQSEHSYIKNVIENLP